MIKDQNGKQRNNRKKSVKPKADSLRKQIKLITRFITNKKRRHRLSHNIRNKSGDIGADLTNNEWEIKKYYKGLHANKFDNFEEMNKCLEIHKALKLTREGIR